MPYIHFHLSPLMYTVWSWLKQIITAKSNTTIRYSCSPGFAGRQLWLKAGAFEVALLDDKYREIVRHPRLYGRQTESTYYPG
ncbi:MAG: hypothetical protein AB1500_01950 [Bacillota bacterium]